MVCFDLYSDNIIPNSPKHMLRRWVTKTKMLFKRHISMKDDLPGFVDVLDKKLPCQKGDELLCFTHNLLRWLSGTESCCSLNKWRRAVTAARGDIPPLGRDSLKSPSVASQVLPSPPHTRHRSSLASELRMLSQPTCFQVRERERKFIFEDWKMGFRI